MRGVPWLHEPRSAFYVSEWPFETNTAVSQQPYPPRDYMYSPKGTFISFLSVWSLTIRFVCTHSYIILHYILLRQTGRWGNFCVVEEESHSCSFTYMYLAQASTGRPLSPEGKKQIHQPRHVCHLTEMRRGNMYARGLHHIHIQTVGVGKF